MSWLLEHGDRETRAEVRPSGTGFEVRVDGRTHLVEGAVGRTMRVRIDARPVEASVRRQGSEVIVEIGGHAHTFRVRDARAPKLARHRRGSDLARGEIHAPMPGLVVDLLISVGDSVEAGRPVVVVEAMKMQNALAAGVSGRVTAIPVARGAAVESGQLLVVIAPEEA
jgi:biotin carboxyl carrier protein